MLRHGPATFYALLDSTMGNALPHDNHPSTAVSPTDQARNPSEYPQAPPPLAEHHGPPIGVAVLGTGQRALGLTTKLCQCSRGEGIKFILYDEDSKIAEEARSILAVWINSRDEKLSPEVVGSLDAAVRHPDVQWVMVTSKNYLHKDYCVAALEAGKHVFCEKPLATTIADCLRIKEAVDKAKKLTFMTGFVLRYAPFYSKIKKLVEDGFLGRIITMEANEMLSADHGGYIFRNWRRFKDQAGPHIMEKCAHDIDILNWMAGSVVTSVAAFGGNDIFTAENKAAADRLQAESSSSNVPMYKSWSGAWEEIDPFTCEKTVEDNVVAVLQYRNGIRATFQTNCCSALPQRQLKIFGVEGTVDGDSMKGRYVAKRMARGSEEIQELVEGGGHAGGDSPLVIELWSAMVFTANQTADSESFHPKSSLVECFISSITCLAIDEARETGRVVDLEGHWKKLGV